MKDTYKKSLEREIHPIYEITVFVQESLRIIQQLTPNKESDNRIIIEPFFSYASYSIYISTILHFSKIFMQKTNLYSNIYNLILSFSKEGSYRTIEIKNETIAKWKKLLSSQQESIAYVLLERESIVNPIRRKINFAIPSIDIDRCLDLNAAVQLILNEIIIRVLKQSEYPPKTNTLISDNLGSIIRTLEQQTEL